MILVYIQTRIFLSHLFSLSLFICDSFDLMFLDQHTHTHTHTLTFLVFFYILFYFYYKRQLEGTNASTVKTFHTVHSHFWLRTAETILANIFSLRFLFIFSNFLNFHLLFIYFYFLEFLEKNLGDRAGDTDWNRVGLISNRWTLTNLNFIYLFMESGIGRICQKDKISSFNILFILFYFLYLHSLSVYEV